MTVTVTAWMDGWLLGSLADWIASAVAVTVTAWMDGWLLGSLADWIASAVAVTVAYCCCDFDCDCVDGWMATWLSGGLDCFGGGFDCG